MLKGIFAALLSSALFVGVGTTMLLSSAGQANAEMAAPKKEEAKKKKEPGGQQNRMKACGAEWQAMKKDGRAKGTTYGAFSKECLKKKT